MIQSVPSLLILLPEGADPAAHAEALAWAQSAAEQGDFPLRVLAACQAPGGWEEVPGRREWRVQPDSGKSGFALIRARWKLLKAEHAREPFCFVLTLASDDQRGAGLWRAFCKPHAFVLRLWAGVEHLETGWLHKLALKRHTAVNFFATLAIAEGMRSAGNADLLLDNPYILTASPLSCEENDRRLKEALEAMSRPSRSRHALKPVSDWSHIRLTYITHFYLNQNRTETVTALLEHYASYAPDLLDRIHFVIVDDGSPLRIEPPELNLNLTWLRVNEDIRWNQGGARNLGVTYAKSDNMLLSDLDLMFPEETLRALTEARPCGKNIFKFKEKDEATGQLRKGHPNTFFLSRARFLRFYGYDEEFTGNYGAEDFRFVKFQKSQGSRQRYFDQRYPYYVRHEIDRKNSYHSLTRDLSNNTPVDSRKRFENEAWGHEHGHSRMALDFTWTLLAQRRRPGIFQPTEDRGWKRRWLLRTLLPWG
ncbi:MAG: glycosyltransferase [Rhodocyclaceae bacterium]|nr:glycosyltransferase [Rhodocyclaceae bacterium]